MMKDDLLTELRSQLSFLEDIKASLRSLADEVDNFSPRAGSYTAGAQGQAAAALADLEDAILALEAIGDI